MRKSEVSKLQGVIQAILADHLSIYPVDAGDIDRDIQRLNTLCQARGAGVFLLDLPAMGKHFDRCLANGLYIPYPGPLGARSGKGALPRLFSGLLARVFDRNSGSLRSDIDIAVVATLRQLYNFAKGFNHECSKKRTAQAALDFYDTERGIRPASLKWEAERISLLGLRDLHFGEESEEGELPLYPTLRGRVEPGRNQYRYEKLQATCDIVAGQFGLFEPDRFRPRHGPGAVSDAKGNVSKYTFPHWPEKLEAVFPLSRFSYLNYDFWVDSLSIEDRSSHEPPSKLIAVPKTAKAPRLIASEPIAHQWCQQMLLRFLDRGIRHGVLRNSISLSDQVPSRELALQASIDGSYATIDLSSASDRLSCWTVERFFRRNPPLVEAFHAVRTRWIRNAVSSGPDCPKYWILRKFTTMGSAVTFPVQSIVFATVAIAAILIKNNARVSTRAIGRAAKSVRVFGDDIIVPTKYYDEVVLLLEYLGLKVNTDKSYATGRFRESCGMDAFMGYDVTPARINTIADVTRPASVTSAIDASNNFFKRGYWRTAAFIESTLPSHVSKTLRVVPADSGVAGLVSFCGAKDDHLKLRWNPDLHRMEVRTMSLKQRNGVYGQTGEHDLFQYFTDEPDPEKSWEPGRVRKGEAVMRFTWEPTQPAALAAR